MDIFLNYIYFFIHNQFMLVFNTITAAMVMRLDAIAAIAVLINYLLILFFIGVIAYVIWDYLPFGGSIILNSGLIIIFIIGMYLIAQVCMTPIYVFLFCWDYEYSIVIGYLMLLIFPYLLILMISRCITTNITDEEDDIDDNILSDQ